MILQKDWFRKGWEGHVHERYLKRIAAGRWKPYCRICGDPLPMLPGPGKSQP